MAAESEFWESLTPLGKDLARRIVNQNGKRRSKIETEFFAFVRGGREGVIEFGFFLNPQGSARPRIGASEAMRLLRDSVPPIVND